MRAVPDIAVVCEPDDPLPWLFARFAADRGLQAACVTAQEWGRAVTVEHDRGVRITPDLPMMLRPLRGPTTGLEEERFVFNECFALLWSAAALAEAPVINRPGELGWGGQASYSASITDLRRGSAAPHTEWLWHRQPPLAPDLLHQDLTTWLTVATPDDDAAIRSRTLPACRGWDQVVVVDEEAWRVTDVDIGDTGIERQSIAAAQTLQLRFCTVSWAIPIEGAPILVRVNPFPTLAECTPVMNDIFSALAGRLMH
ncbi:hypothetical protein ACSBM8_02530 [Sphingomonas sp. ASY06-1R]|jgi:hypothetical protein|uniref:hypothetical protein n=1 Tax=Sphingomonas sp. ASY06-1R TaxID=3445771 RepID=UPI003FA25E96